MEEKVIKLNPTDVLVLKIETDRGEKTGEELRFDLEDTQLFLRYEELIKKDKANRIELQNKLTIINKQEDVKAENLLSRNEKARLEAINVFFKKEVDVYNMFLGENGVQKLLNGRAMTWKALDEIDEIIDKQIKPYLDANMQNITNKIKQKYSFNSKVSEEIEVLE